MPETRLDRINASLLYATNGRGKEKAQQTISKQSVGGGETPLYPEKDRDRIDNRRMD